MFVKAVNYSIRKIRYLQAAVLVIIVLPCIWFVNYNLYCDEAEQHKLVRTSDGRHIPKYKDTKDDIPFGKLVDQCDYADNKIKCTDVRHKGDYLNRQTNLVIARMHAIFHLICQKHSIQYWILSGSLLGANRDGVLIPWETDGDVGMMLEDYQKLLKYVRLELPDDMYFQDASDNDQFKRKVCNAKLRDRNSCYGHCLRTGCKRHDGIQVDIFVFKRSEKDPAMIKSMFGKFHFPLADILPTKPITLEGVAVSGPANVHNVLLKLYGAKYTERPPRHNKCTYAGYIAIPWYSCEHINSLSAEQQSRILKDSMDHGSVWFWYIG